MHDARRCTAACSPRSPQRRGARTSALRAALVVTLAAALVGATPPGPAAAPRADDVPRFVVVPLHEISPARVEALYGALEQSGARVVDRSARAGVDLPLAPELFRAATLDDPRAALLAARAALRELALEDVDARLDEALAAALRLPNPAEHKDLLSDILLLRAELALARNLPADARTDLRLLARLDERRGELHPGLFPPNVVAAYQDALAANQAAGAGYLALVAEATAGAVTTLVDGREVSVAGVHDGLDVGAGPHLVTLLAPGHVSRSFVVDVSASEPLAVTAQLFPPRADEERAAALAILRRARDDDTALRRLLASSGASAALVLAEVPAVFTLTRGRVPLSVDDAAPALALARAALVAARPLPPRVAAVGGAVAPSSPPPEEASALPLLIGGGVVVAALVLVGAGAGALAFALQPPHPVPPPPTPVVGTCCGQEP